MAVHVVLQDDHPDEVGQTTALANEIYSRLTRGARPAAIPTRVWSGKMTASGVPDLPSPPSMVAAERNLVILLVDQPMFESRKHWQTYFRALAQSRRGSRDLILPVSIFGDAHRVSNEFRDINHVPVEDPDTVATDEHVFHAILTAILRLLPEEDTHHSRGERQDCERDGHRDAIAPQVFLCHSKSDGDPLARKLRRYIYEQTQLTGFFDIHDIPHGHGVRSVIKSSITVSSVLVIWTDRMLDSRWCQFEILEARSQQRPLLVLDALSVESPRVFPFLSNMPVLRWRNNPGQVVNAVLLELVRTRHIRALFESLCGTERPAPRFMLHPPDIMEAGSVLRGGEKQAPTGAPTSELVVYPDPPIPAEELDFLREALPTLHLCSLSEWMALRAAGELHDASSYVRRRKCPLEEISIGLSVSPAESWPSLGLIGPHQDDYVIDIARQLILLGARLLWGGDLRANGIGVRLESLVEIYHQADHAPQDHIACYLAWPLQGRISPKELRACRAYADVQCLPNPLPRAAASVAFDALCYSLMRRQLASESQARIILGGKLSGYLGRYPGIAEEALESVRSERALYIVGGFGGASRAVYDAIAGSRSDLSLEAAWRDRCKDGKVLETNTVYDGLAKSLGSDLRVDHEAMLRRFGELGLAGLSRLNGLTEEENGRLATSQNIHEIIGLLVRGLTNCQLSVA